MRLIDAERRTELEGRIKFFWQNRDRAEELNKLTEEILIKGGYVRGIGR